MNVEAVRALQQKLTVSWHAESATLSQESVSQHGLLGLVARNHLENFNLWHEEDIARCNDLGAERIRQAKRTIDRHNQQRNDLIESIDRHMVQALQPAEQNCSFNSETPGMMIDRLSILALKEYHMREEAEREDAADAHRTSCLSKLAVIEQQIGDLTTALIDLLLDVAARRRSFRVYFQFKMYNDEQLNPQLRRSA